MRKPLPTMDPLPTVSLAKLIDGDIGTVNELTSACCDIGFLTWTCAIAADVTPQIPNNALFDLDPKHAHDGSGATDVQVGSLEDFLSRDLKDCIASASYQRTGLGLLKYLPYGSSDANIGHIAHTNLGDWQSSSPTLAGYKYACQAWRFGGTLLPNPGTRSVNAGDSLTAFPKSALRSCLHRIEPHARLVTDQVLPRLSMRPEYDTRFHRE
ncbi:uncharacterized protein P174DRAFT_455669 [Aspergillus novofumigatus IBT 16806]|uniref:Uncharacterized protein n=1 Tax=Aspergillus novofumigatus (strain IBT 16806) TaxID=1392255 RepID=A0A2I1BS05_ASPN1|nr:uncharacterized protein P174DRAFT_455669 [Aspergillus novofumigatus IBT 16806]PKX88169.1 hypothetical protein P174DRAFT_455669 [Aspergillus novofumigatus IBT 16806]